MSISGTLSLFHKPRHGYCNFQVTQIQITVKTEHSSCPIAQKAHGPDSCYGGVHCHAQGHLLSLRDVGWYSPSCLHQHSLHIACFRHQSTEETDTENSSKSLQLKIVLTLPLHVER